MRGASSIRFGLSTAAILVASVVLVQGCSSILFDGFDKVDVGSGGGGSGAGGEGGVGGMGVCEPTACDAMDTECSDFSCNADNTACESTDVAEGDPCRTNTTNICDANGQCVCNSVTCDGMDTECVDFACNAENTGCDLGTTVAEGQPCLMTTGNVCDDQAMCVPVECINAIQDGEETDIDCGGSVCSGCNNNQMCSVNSDCRSNNCDGTTCQPCTDGGNHCNGVTDTYCDDENADVAEQVCKPLLGDGNPCDAPTYNDEQCLNGNCQPDDGVCCDSACNAPDCQSCLGAATGLTDGTCAAVQAGMDPDGDCTENLGGSAVNGCEGNACSGNGASCAPAAGGTCRASAGNCDISEICNGVILGCPGDVVQGDGFNPMNCNGYLCDGALATCPTTCANDTECESTHFCDGSNNCVLKLTNGTVCNGGNECSSGNCPPGDGVCCNVACNGTCEGCAESGSVGACAAYAAGTNPETPPECGSGEACDGAGVGISSCKLLIGQPCTMGSECISGVCNGAGGGGAGGAGGGGSGTCG